jgi:periplasmic divalent cation tolerance protein
MSLLYVPCKNSREAEKIARSLLKEKLIACGNVIPKMKSVYRWKGKIKQNSEALLLAKTSARKARKAIKRVEELHSYDSPVVYSLSVEAANVKALKWLAEELK